MIFKNTQDSYGLVAIILHWLVAALVLSAIGIGLYMVDMPSTPDRGQMYGLHKSLGVCVLFLALARLLWRILNTAPEPLGTLARWQKILAGLVHKALYALTLLIPFSGWAMSSAAGRDTSLFGLVTLPRIVAEDQALRGFFGTAHWVMAYATIAILVLHLGAVAVHTFIHKDETLRRMVLGFKAK